MVLNFRILKSEFYWYIFIETEFRPSASYYFGLNSVSYKRAKIQIFDSEFQAVSSVPVVDNGKELCEVRATATEISRGD